MLEKCLVIFKPIHIWIKFFQKDHAEVSIVYKAFYELPGVFEQLPISDKENIYLKKLSKERFDFMYGNTHGVGYILDPRFIGDGMSQQVWNKIEYFIFVFWNEDRRATTEGEKVAISQEYTQWKIKALMEKSNTSFHFKILGTSKTILQYWQSDGTHYPSLQCLAIKVFSMPASNAASEQCFSTFGFIHSKLWNSLGPDKVKKLVYIKINVVQ